MRRLVLPLLLALPLTMTACGDGGDSGEAEAAAGPAAGTAAGTAAGAGARIEPSPAAPAGAGAGAGEVALSDALTGGRPLAGAEAPAAPAQPEPNRFDPGGEISDEQLSGYYPALTFAVDGEEVGTLTLELWGERAPVTVRNFLRLCDTGFYEGVSLHRILRDFMVQGGDPTGTGTGDSPYGTIQAEFSEDPERAHGYGVVSMARMGQDPNSASCQFFICCNEGGNVWGLDGQYASFGRLTSGVAVLEALADVPVTSNGRENSTPTLPVTIVRTEVREGAAPRGEVIERPAPDLGGEPAVIEFQHALVSFQGAPRSPATRSREEAEQLVKEIVDKARAGEDFSALVVAHSDAASAPDDDTPSVYRARNFGVNDLEAERAAFALIKQAQAEMGALGEKVQSGELDQAAAQAKQAEIYAEVNVAMERAGVPRAELPEVVGDVAFSLGVGEVGVVEHDANTSPMGWHVIKRLE